MAGVRPESIDLVKEIYNCTEEEARLFCEFPTTQMKKWKQERDELIRLAEDLNSKFWTKTTYIDLHQSFRNLRNYIKELPK